MRNALFAAILAFAPLAVFADSTTCSQPSLTLATIQGSMPAPCSPAFDYTTVNLSATNTGGSTGSGAGTGKSVQTLSFTRPFDQTSLALYNACLTGKHLQSGSVRLDANTLMKLTDVMVSSWQASGGNTNVTESFTLNFSKVEMTYGSGGGKVVTSYTGTAHMGGAMAMYGGGGGAGTPGEISHFDISVRPGSQTANIQFKQQAVRAGMAGKAAPANTNFGDGSLELRSRTGAPLGKFSFQGGVFNGGTLRASRLSVAPTAAMAVRP